MKKNRLLISVVFSVFCIVLFAGSAIVGAADMNKGMMMDNGKMMMDNGKMMMDKGKMMSDKGMKTEGSLMMRDGKLLMRHGKSIKEAGESEKMLMKENYAPEKEFKGWQETDTGG